MMSGNCVAVAEQRLEKAMSGAVAGELAQHSPDVVQTPQILASFE